MLKFEPTKPVPRRPEFRLEKLPFLCTRPKTGPRSTPLAWGVLLGHVSVKIGQGEKEPKGQPGWRGRCKVRGEPCNIRASRAVWFPEKKLRKPAARRKENSVSWRGLLKARSGGSAGIRGCAKVGCCRTKWARIFFAPQYRCWCPNRSTASRQRLGRSPASVGFGPGALSARSALAPRLKTCHPLVAAHTGNPKAPAQFCEALSLGQSSLHELLSRFYRMGCL